MCDAARGRVALVETYQDEECDPEGEDEDQGDGEEEAAHGAVADGFFWLGKRDDRVRRVKDYGRIVGEIRYVQTGQVEVGVVLRYCGCMVWYRTIVNDICICGSSFEQCESPDKD